jgi:hypothetical protein
MKKKAFTRNERLAAIAGAALPPPLKMAKEQTAHPWYADAALIVRQPSHTPNKQACGVNPKNRANSYSTIYRKLVAS